MQSRLTEQAIFFNKQTWFLLFLFFAARATSYALSSHAIAQAVIVFLLIMILGVVYFKSQDCAWMIVLGEMFIGGAGHLLEFFGLSIRTVLIITFLFLWFSFSLLDQLKKHQLKIPHRIFHYLIPLFALLVISAVVGVTNGNGLKHVIQDLVPFSFFLLVLPAYHLFKEDKMRHYFIRLTIVFIIGSAIFSLFTYILFSSGIAELHDPFYKWFRDVAMGKITPMTLYFYRVVLPSHLLMTPAVLIILSMLMKDEKHHKMWRVLLALGLLVLVLNFSRSYLLGLTAGVLALKYKHNMKKWIKESVWAALIFISLFICVNVLSSLGQNVGAGLFGLRLGSITSPETELSGLTRMGLLHPIFDKIKKHPIMGSGLGSGFVYTSPTNNTPVSTRQFDWGYLEMWAELGLIGAAWFLVVIGSIIFELIKKIRQVPDYHDFKVGLLAGVIALLVINITTPALFHVISIFFFTFIIAFVTKPIENFDLFVTMLYRIFNKLKSQSIRIAPPK